MFLAGVSKLLSVHSSVAACFMFSCCLFSVQLLLLFSYLMVQKFTVGFNFLDNPHQQFSMSKKVRTDAESNALLSNKRNVTTDSFSGYGSMDAAATAADTDDSCDVTTQCSPDQEPMRHGSNRPVAHHDVTRHQHATHSIAVRTHKMTM